jgi:L-rhamnose mutarotase
VPTIAFRMELHAGKAEEYLRRHEALWPELAALLRQSGVTDYSIWLDPQTHHLFAILKVTDERSLEALPAHAVMRRWWDHMADIMEVNADRSPVQVPLQRMFHLA